MSPRLCRGCGASFSPSRLRQRYRSQACSRAATRGAGNGNYNHGLSEQPDGRVLICCRDGSTVAYARAVVEAGLARHLEPDEIVHHVNGDWTDDRRENLQLTSRAEHIEIHRDELLAARGLGRVAA